MRFNPPSNWPRPSEGWAPPSGWQPDPAWGPAPEGWQLWIEEEGVGHQAAAPEPPVKPQEGPLARSPGADDGTRRTVPIVSRAALAAFVGVTVLASGNGVAIRFTLDEIDPLWSAALRFVLASIALTIVMTALRLRWPRGHELTGAVVFGALGLAVTFALANYALQHIHAGLGQTLLALVPLATLLLAVDAGQEKLRVLAVSGALVAAVGVGVVSWQGAPEPVPVLTVLAILGSVLSVAVAAVFVRRFPPVHPVAMNAVAVTVAAALLLLAALLAGEDLTLPARGTTWTALGYLAVVGSVVVFSLHLVVLKHWSASRANYVFVLIPLLTIPLSARLQGETVGAGLVAGAALVLTGVYLGALRGTWASAPPTPSRR